MASDRIEEERWSSMQRIVNAQGKLPNNWEVHHIPPVPVEKVYIEAEVLELMQMTRHDIQHHIPWVAKVMLEEYNKDKQK